MADPLAGLGGGVNAGPGSKRNRGGAGLAGVRGGTNAAQRFPMPLDHPSSGLKGLTGSVNAPARAPTEARGAPIASLRGLRGATNATPPKVPNLVGLYGHTLAAQRTRGPGAPRTANPSAQLKQVIGNIQGEEGKLNQFLKGGGAAVGRGERVQSLHEQQRRQAKAASTGNYRAGGLIGLLTNPFAAVGIHSVGNVIGQGEREAINIPTQILPASYHADVAAVNALKGHPGEANRMGKEFGEHSVLGAALKGAYGMATGDPTGAIKAVERIPTIAGEHPGATALEVSGVGHAIDHGLGSFADATGLRKNMIESGGASLEGPSRAGRELIPGGATKAMPAYSKGLLRQKVEKYVEAKPMSEMGRKLGLEKHFNAFQGQMRRIVAAGREMTKAAGRRRIAALKAGEEDLITPAGKWLAHPDVRSPKGDYPLWRDQISQKIERLNRMTPDSRESTNPLAIEARDAQIHYLQRILDDRNLEKGEGRKAFAAAEAMAKDKGRLKGELSGTHFTPEEMRIAEMKPAFHEYFHDERPVIDTTVPEGESPFRLGGITSAAGRKVAGGAGGRTIPVDQVDQMLHDKGFRREQRFFTSDNPNRTEQMAFRGGYSPGGQKTSKGVLTGQNFTRGQSDLSYPHAVAQHAYEQLLVNIAHGDREMVDNYFHNKEAAAKLIEAKLGDVGPKMREFYQNHIDQLRHEHGAQFWEERNGRGPAERAAETKKILEKLYPDRRFEVAHLARPYATARYRGAIAPKTHEDISDRMDPYQHAEAPEDLVSLFPQLTEADAGTHAGRVGLVDKVIADKMRAYDTMTKGVSLSQAASNFWRRNNIAFSIRHIPGVMKEMGYRMAASNIGPLSALTARRAMPYLQDYADRSTDPNVKLGWKRLQAYIRGTVAAYSDDLRRRISMEDLHSKPRIYAAAKALKGNPITGNALKGVQAILGGRGKFPGYNKITDTLLKYQRNLIEHPPQVAGVGRHYRDEFKALTGKSLRVFGPMRDVEKEFYAGRLNRASVDHSIQAFRDYWGEWNRADPTTRKAMVVMPFFQWYVNSLRFLYHTMPVHHPEKTAVLVMLENATEEQRKAEGQGYQGGFPLGTKLNPGELEPSQQGSIPFGAGFRGGEEYYSPSGAVSGGLDTALNALFPYAMSAMTTAAGYNMLTKKPIEDINPETGKKEQVTNQNNLALDAANGLLESFLPIARYVKSAEKEIPVEKQDPLTKLLIEAGLPPGWAHALRPLRTEGEYKVKEPKGAFGGFGGFGSSGGFSGFGK